MIEDAWSRRLQRALRIGRLDAKFVSVSNSSAFIDPAAELGDGFVYVNLYDEDVDSNVFPFRGRIVMIHNTYLASFAYNLFLSWLYSHSGRAEPSLDRLLAHNFKKFFAEQLWRQRSDVASRALLLETLLFEQVCMVPVFAAQAQDPALAKGSQDAATLMSLLLSMHELGHFMLDSRPGGRTEFLAELPPAAASLFARAARRLPEPLLEELRCDMLSVLSCFRENRAALGDEFVLRVIVFAFAAYGVMFSLAKSARAYRDAREGQPPETIDLRSIAKLHREHEIPLGHDHDFARRARLVAEFCQLLADEAGVNLYDSAGALPLPETIAEELMACVDKVLACEDPNARSMANLVAEAMDGHPEGMEYLYLRSKTFTSNGAAPARV